MPRCSEELTNSRRDEIINACAALYESMSFKEITLKEIGKITSFTRTSIYNYFQTKEEIFLALMQREYEEWVTDISAIMNGNEIMDVEAFSDALARTLENRKRLLKLISMNLYDIEADSSLESLISFKRAYGSSILAVSNCLRKFFPKMTEAEIQNFIYAFFPFMFGIYPYTEATEKQKKAMDEAGVNYVCLTVHDICFQMISGLLNGSAYLAVLHTYI